MCSWDWAAEFVEFIVLIKVIDYNQNFKVLSRNGKQMQSLLERINYLKIIILILAQKSYIFFKEGNQF